MDRDSEAYELVVSAYRLPKGTDDEKAARARGIQDALKAAIAAPLEVMRACGAGHRAADRCCRHTATRMRRAMCRWDWSCCARGCAARALNVEINLGSVKDQAYLAEVAAEIAQAQ